MAAVGLILFLRPFFPAMPFKIGNTIEIGDLLGIMEGITFVNMSLKTTDGKTFFIPNRKIINDTIIFDCEGIRFAFPQLELHCRPDQAGRIDSFDAAITGAEFD